MYLLNDDIISDWLLYTIHLVHNKEKRIHFYFFVFNSPQMFSIYFSVSFFYWCPVLETIYNPIVSGRYMVRIHYPVSTALFRQVKGMLEQQASLCWESKHRSHWLAALLTDDWLCFSHLYQGRLACLGHLTPVHFACNLDASLKAHKAQPIWQIVIFHSFLLDRSLIYNNGH